MKKIILLFTLLIANNSFAQDYMDKIIDDTCNCLDKVADTIVGEDFNMQLGLCMIDAARPYKKKIKKDHKIDLNNIDEEGEALGELIGLKMVGVCPNILIEISKRSKETVQKEVVAQNTITGKITKIEEDQFVSFSLKDGEGKTKKFYWLNHIESDIDLYTEYKNLKHKAVKITYRSEEFFDPRIGEYHTFNIISKIEKIRTSSGSLVSSI
ncbi:hypothetical protein [Flavicella marina]|uniref:hypothetical protein n=1 Tax=Flavicella marina TaxID=1475951 RepID=UPI0012655429|nr:hypothetical protein [Flavicella marina]